jgi:hypothetical protein
MTNDNNIILKRFTLLKRLDYFIEESIYYRTHSESFLNKKNTLININQNTR